MSRDDASHMPPELRDALEPSSDDQAPSGRRRDWAKVWALLERAAPSDHELPDAEQTWAAVREHVATEESGEGKGRRAEDRTSVRRSSGHRRSRVRLWQWKSAVAVGLVLVFAIWWWSQPVEWTTSPGTTMSRTLPDGSIVELNADSRLTRARSFSAVSALEADERRVRLEGEAYFEVDPGNRPFVVETPTARIEVVGTKFSVRSREHDNNSTHVALADGRLRVRGRSSDDSVRSIAPGQATTVDPAGRHTAVRDTSIERVLAWRRGGFAVTAQPLPVLAQTLERRFGRPIRLAPSISEATRSDPLTLYYSQAVGLEDILHDVSMARDLTYRATANGYVLARRNNAATSQSP